MAGPEAQPFAGLEETNEFHSRAADRMAEGVAEHTQQARHEDWEAANMQVKCTVTNPLNLCVSLRPLKPNFVNAWAIRMYYFSVFSGILRRF